MQRTSSIESILTKSQDLQTRSTATQGDRFIPTRGSMNMDVGHFNLVQGSENVEEPCLDKAYKATLAAALLGEPNLEEQKILTLKSKAPAPAPGMHNELRVLYTQNVGQPVKATARYISTQAEKVLDAPGMQDDYYLNLLDWSPRNVLSVALQGAVYLWNATSNEVVELFNGNTSVTSVSFNPSAPQFLAVGMDNNQVQLWDVERSTQLRTLSGHSARVGSLAWNGHILSSGSFDTSIINHDVRVASPMVNTFSGHNGEVCGLKWSLDGTQLASGGNDNLLNVWQMDTVGSKFTFTDHQAAVKALAWCPWQPNLLASGGGSADRNIKFWNTQTGTLLNSIDTESQVCSIQWSRNSKELVSSHGFSKNQLCVWKYPSMTKIAELTGHEHRVLHMASSPDGTSVVTGSADETLRFWKVFEASKVSVKKAPVPGVTESVLNSRNAMKKIR